MQEVLGWSALDDREKQSGWHRQSLLAGPEAAADIIQGATSGQVAVTKLGGGYIPDSHGQAQFHRHCHCNYPRSPSRLGKAMQISPAPHVSPQTTGPDGTEAGESHRSRRAGTLAAAACVACRRHKLKCNGDRPACGRCIAARRPCIYTTMPGERPAQALKRNHNAWRKLVETYEELFHFIRALPERQAIDIYRRMRAGFDVDTLVAQIRGGDLVLQLAVAPESRFRYQFPYRTEMPDDLKVDNPYLDCLLYEATSLLPSESLSTSAPLSSLNSVIGDAANWTVYLRPFHAARTVDPRIIDVKPSLWTTISTDDSFMRGLLEGFFLSEYALASAFQKDYFLEDMAARRNDFCSSMLVNVVLAYSCVQSSDLLLQNLQKALTFSGLLPSRFQPC
ncbi:hypothetical protein ANO11243_018200 [Dothideomycetidae sp. 11243]|nr:hypothetical protein ANO11243_018200 [fungal sp. No.11243]